MTGEQKHVPAIKTGNEKTAGAVIEFKSVCKTLKSRKVKIDILEECSLMIPRDRLTVLIGPSGCGKTTLINLIAGYETQDSGTVLVDGRPIQGPGRDRLVVFQEMALFPWLTCQENIVFGPTTENHAPADEIEARALLLLERIGLKNFKDKYPSQLSGGMQRRVELARALINNPAVMLLDEPFRGLDAMTKELMQDYYLDLFASSGGTHLFVTSDLEEAVYLADTIMVLTSRPSRLKLSFSVDLPRPRNRTMTGTAYYGRVKNHLLEVLREEIDPGRGNGPRDSSEAP